MAKIAFLGNFRVDYSTETHHSQTLESMGHTVYRLQETVANSSKILKVASNSDLFVWVHTHGWGTPGRLDMRNVLRELKSMGIPTMTYHLDLWFGLKRQDDLDKDPIYKHIEHFFTVDKQMADWFNEKTDVNGHYLPAAVFSKESYYTPTKLEHEVIFVGSKEYHPEWQYRPQLINWLSDTYDSFELYGRDGKGAVRGDSLNKLYASTKVVVGDTLCPDFKYKYYWSDRIYETIGRGGFIIHPYIKGLEEEFEDKKNVVFYEYGNFDQLKKLIDYYLIHADERETIRKAGFELVNSKYTYKNRWLTILDKVGVK
jgi:hypothetical protein